MDKDNPKTTQEMREMQLIESDYFSPGPQREFLKPPTELQVWERFDFYYICFGGFCLAWIAGYLNCVIIIQHKGITVSHATGTTSKMAISLANFDFTDVFHKCFLLLAFFMGCVSVGFAVTKEKFYYSRKYGIILLIESFLLFIGIQLFEESKDELAMLFTSMAMGIHNSLFTNFSGAVVRTTHVTGLITDIGLIIGHFIRGREENKDLWRLKVLLPLYIGFICGGISGTLLLKMLGQSCLYIPLFILVAIGALWTLWRVVYKSKSDEQVIKLQSIQMHKK